ncbi:hypothetical protein RQP46_001810 [Phenoliferia psychrophenolica]
MSNQSQVRLPSPSPTPSTLPTTASPPPIASTSTPLQLQRPDVALSRATLPAVGTVFPSLLDLKLACFDYALHASPPISFGILNTYTISRGQRVINLGCAALGYGVGSCPFRLQARSVLDSDAWTVRSVDDSHSHSTSVSNEYELETVRDAMRDRIGRARAQGPDSRERKTHGSDDIGGGSEKSERDGVDRRRVHYREVSETEESENDDEDSDDGANGRNVKPATLFHAPLHNLRPSINHLATTSKLQFPLPSNTVSFPDHQTMRIYASAAAIQRGFTLFLFGNKSKRDPLLSSFELACSRNHSRYGDDRCTFAMTVSFDGTGWSCSHISKSHRGHEVQKDDKDGHMVGKLPDELALPTGNGNRFLKPTTASAAQVPQKRKLTSSTESGSTSVKSGGPSNVQPAGSGRPIASLPLRGAHLDKASQPWKPPSRLPPLETPPIEHFTSHPTPPTTTSRRLATVDPLTTDALKFTPHLSAFLADRSPSLASYTPTFLAAGLTNFDRLANVVLIPNDRLVASGWIDELAKDVVDGEGRVVVKGLPKLLQAIFLKSL